MYTQEAIALACTVIGRRTALGRKIASLPIGMLANL